VPKDKSTEAQAAQGIHSKVLNDLVEKDEDRPMLTTTDECPPLTEEQVRQAVSVVPADYWSMSCWTCRDEGHSTFTCKYLTPVQRLYFAYRYFLYQCEANPRIAEFLEDRLAWRLDPKNKRNNPWHDKEERTPRGRDFGYPSRGRGGYSGGRGGGGYARGGRGGSTWRPTDRRGMFSVKLVEEKQGVEADRKEEEGGNSGPAVPEEEQGKVAG